MNHDIMQEALRFINSNEKVRDVVVFTNSSYVEPRHDIRDLYPPIQNRFDLSSDLWIARLPNELAKNILSACEPAGYNFKPVRPFSQLYAFVRENPPGDERYRWDPDKRLQLCVALSRIIHPTSVSL